MNDLLSVAVNAHGGRSWWHQLKTVKARLEQRATVTPLERILVTLHIISKAIALKLAPTNALVLTEPIKSNPGWGASFKRRSGKFAANPSVLDFSGCQQQKKNPGSVVSRGNSFLGPILGPTRPGFRQLFRG